MTKERARRISGYRIIERRKIETDAGILELRVYIGKDYSEAATKFKAVNDDFGIEETNTDLDKAVEAATIKIKESATVDWKPYLYVKVAGDHDLQVVDEEDDDDDPDPFITNDRSNSTHSMHIDIKVERIEVSDANNKKQWRGRGHYNAQVREGWPEVGLEIVDPDRQYWQSTTRDMRALVPDTPENRQAFENIRGGMRTLLRKLESLLSPENIEEALEYASTGGLLLGSGEAPKPKKKARKKTNKRSVKKRSKKRTRKR